LQLHMMWISGQWNSFGITEIPEDGAVCGRNMSREEGVIVVAFLMELYCVSSYINATGCLNTLIFNQPLLLSIYLLSHAY
jgi:hypothetical protein